MKDNSYDKERLLSSPEENESPIEKETVKEYTSDDEYYPLGTDRASRSLLFSVLSLILAVLSIFIFSFYYLSIPISVGAVVCSVIARRRLGYFDNVALLGLIFAIFGFVFATGSLVLDCLGILDAMMGR